MSSTARMLKMTMKKARSAKTLPIEVTDRAKAGHAEWVKGTGERDG